MHRTAWFCLTIVTAVYAVPYNESPNNKQLYTDYSGSSNASSISIGRRAAEKWPRRWYESSCSGSEVSFIASAWEDAALLAKAQTGSVEGFDYGAVHTNWLGRDWNYNSWFPWGNKYWNVIKGNLERMAKYYTGDAENGQQVFFYCREVDSASCTIKDGKKAYALTWDEGNNHYIMLCPQFWTQQTLGYQMKRYEGDKESQKYIDNFQVNSGSSLLHESWHFDSISKPKLGDVGYGVNFAWDLAKQQGTETAYTNTDSWKFDGIAIYVQQYYKNDQTPIPYNRRTGTAILTSLPPTEGPESISLGSPPESLKGQIPGQGDPDSAKWKQLPDVDPFTSHTCAGTATTHWMSYDALNGAIPTFCEEAEKQGAHDKDSGSIRRDYLNGPDAVSLTIQWPSDVAFKPSKAECVKNMNIIMNDCDGNDQQHNPMNWKHGGFKQDGSVSYGVVPTAEKYVTGTCRLHVHEEHTQILDFSHLQGGEQFQLTVDVMNGDGETIGGTKTLVTAGDGNPYIYNGLYQPLQLTPESQNGDYIQFSIGDAHWTTSSPQDGRRCQVGDWTSDSLPKSRDMDCFFPC